MVTSRLVPVVLLMGLAGCRTVFTGSAHVENGRAGCDVKCKGVGMQVAGMVYMGEYSSACVCEAPRASAASGRRQELLAAAGSAAGGVAGVEMQTQQDEEQQRASMHH